MPSFRYSLAASACLLAGCGGATLRSMSGAQSTAIVDSVRATLAALTNRLNAADRDSALRFYLDDPRFVWAADGHVATHSVAEIREQFQALAGFPRWHIEYVNPTIIPLAPGLAEVTTEYAMTLADSAGKAVSFAGANTMLWITTPGGWKILGGHSSSQVPAHR